MEEDIEENEEVEENEKSESEQVCVLWTEAYVMFTSLNSVLKDTAVDEGLMKAVEKNQFICP